MEHKLHDFDEFLNEGARQTPQQVDSIKRKKIQMAMKAANDLIKTKPEKAAYYRAKLAYLAAKVKVLDAYKKMLAAKG